MGRGRPQNLNTQKILSALTTLYNELTYKEYDTAKELVTQIMYCIIADRSGVFVGRRFHQLLKNTTENDLLSTLNGVFKCMPADLNTIHQQFPIPLQKKLVQLTEIDFEFKPNLIGSMLESIMSATEQSTLGAHHTSENIISRTVNPLFLDKLRNDVFECKSESDYEQLYESICSLTILDPAVGCGNFLANIYIAIAEIEAEIVSKIGKRTDKSLSPKQFYGIDISAKAVQLCRLSLSVLSRSREQLIAEVSSEPLPRIKFEFPEFMIKNENALRTDWAEIVEDVSYIVGNPPFIGNKNQSQREDIARYFGSTCKADYCAAFIAKAHSYMKRFPNTRCAFVLTASVVQGTQVPLVWENIFRSGLIINFCEQPFPWTSDAVRPADLHCVIIGFSHQDNYPKIIYRNKQTPKKVQHINAYLAADEDYFLKPSEKQIDNLPPMRQGHPVSTLNRCQFCEKSHPNSIKYIAAADMMKGHQRYVTSPININTDNYIVIPRHSSENRKYIPIVFLKNDKVIINSSCHMILKGNLFIFGLLNSAIHMAFTKQYCGRLGMQYRYSSDIIYNNLVLPNIITNEQYQNICNISENILNIRQKHCEQSLGDMYMDMPIELEEAHRKLDVAFDKIYAGRVLTDPERVSIIIKLIKMKKSDVSRDTNNERALPKALFY